MLEEYVGGKEAMEKLLNQSRCHLHGDCLLSVSHRVWSCTFCEVPASLQIAISAFLEWSKEHRPARQRRRTAADRPVAALGQQGCDQGNTAAERSAHRSADSRRHVSAAHHAGRPGMPSSKRRTQQAPAVELQSCSGVGER